MEMYTVVSALVLVAVPVEEGLQLREEDAVSTTVHAIRLAGSALMSWMSDRPCDWPLPAEWPPVVPDRIDWRDCPRLTYEEAVSLIEPDYLPRLPRLDGWGRPLELCLERDGNPLLPNSVGVRSAGADGIFQGPIYDRGASPPSDPRTDLVWVDGRFVTWVEGSD